MQEYEKTTIRGELDCPIAQSSTFQIRQCDVRSENPTINLIDESVFD